MSEPTLTISVRDLHALVDPVLPCASTDSMLPVLTAVQIRSHGEWLVASATDRFRLGVNRQKGEWPEWEALVPTRTLRSIFATFKAGRGSNPEITLTITNGGNGLRVEMAGGFSDSLFTEASIVYPLVTGEFPNLGKILREAIAAEPGTGDRRFNWTFLSAFKAADHLGTGLTMRAGEPDKPMLVSDGDDFIGILMPRRIEAHAQLDLSSWDSILSPAPAKKAPARKRSSGKPKAEAVAS